MEGAAVGDARREERDQQVECDDRGRRADEEAGDHADAADDLGDEIIGVWHSHTHTDPYPSPTDVRQAVDPMWVYVIVSLRDDAPMLRAYRIRDGVIAECSVVIDG